MPALSLTKIVSLLGTFVCIAALAGPARHRHAGEDIRVVPLANAPVQLELRPAALASPRARAPKLRLTRRGALTVLDANVAEYLNSADNRQGRDLSNFVRRAKQVLAVERAHGKPVAAPDLVFLQEVDRATAIAVARRVSHAFGHRYRLAGGRHAAPAPGRGAIVRRRSRHHALLTRATAVLYNAATMNRPTGVRMITFAYPKAQMWTARSCRRSRVECQPGIWESRQSAIFRFTSKRAPHRAFAVASIHFEPYRFVRPRLRRGQVPGFRQARWFNQLTATVAAHFPHTHKILAGDFNDYLCGRNSAHVGQRSCRARRQYTALFRSVLARPRYHAAIGSGIDHIFTPNAVAAAGKDRTYRLPARRAKHGRVVTEAPRYYLFRRDYATRFPTSSAFDRCDALFSRGRGLSRAARRIPGCVNRYYSDHPLDWAVIR